MFTPKSDRQRIFHVVFITILFISAVFLFAVQVNAGGNTSGGGRSGGGSISNISSCGSSCTQYNRAGETYQTRSSDYNRDGDIRDANEVSTSCMSCDRGSDRSSGTRTPTPTPTTCTARPNLQTVDIFFVPAGAQPVTTPARTFVSTRNGTRPDDRVRVVIPASTSYAPIMVPRNQLEVGLSYEPIAMIRNVAPCTTSTSGSAGQHDSPDILGPRTWLPIPVAYAGGGSGGSQPNDYPNNFRTQLPFGSNGSFPIRARIDIGNNQTYEWEHYFNAIGPLGNGRTIYVRLPVFTTTETGTHRIGIVTDIRHSVDPDRGCFATTTPASAGWGCVRETSETDNDRGETFTTVTGSTSLQLAVDVSDITVRAGTALTQVPFVTTNNGRATISDYRYRIMVGSTLFASTTRTTNLVPTSRETVNGSGSYLIASSSPVIPLTVCARIATSTEVCDTARVIVATPQCADVRDNDSDGTQDATDPSCYTDPLDPSTYDPNDNNEGDLASTSASVTIEFKPVVNPVRYNTGAALSYIINGPAAMTCEVTGGGTNSNITHTPPRTTGQVITAPVTSTQQYTLRCTATVGGGTLQFERTTTVDVLPQIQET